MRIKISSDSTCDLPAEITEKNDISIVPLYLVCKKGTLRDGVDITPDELYSIIEEEGKISSTAAVNVQEYTDVFAGYLKDYDAVIHFTISSSMSSCCQNAVTAAESLENVYVIDSKNLSTGIGHLVLDAAQLAREGMPPEKIKEILDRRREKLDVSFVLSTLEFMRMGGRCSSVAAFGANLLGIKPEIEVRDGVMGVGKKYRGPLDKSLVKYVREKLADPETVDPRRIFVTDSGVDEKTWRLVEDTVRECVPFEEVIHTRAGCTISGHCGPGCLGILFYRK
ncbi:MAG: DegV family protein [Oscillospiraceae bacterium]|nr:DegV family protein [Oscillospiraceae bacterium]